MKNQIHMKLAKTLMVIIGIWPLDLSGYKLKFYNAYFYITFTYYILFDVSMAVMVLITKNNFLETVRNLNITIVYVINIYKVLICRSLAMKLIVEEIGNREKLILQSSDQAIKEIYNKHVKSALISMMVYVSIGTSAVFLYFIAPLVKNYMEIKSYSNEKPTYLIFLSWFPFDSAKHYFLAYLIQLSAGFYGYSYIVYVGALFICILKFIIGQIKILQHIFRNFDKYVVKYAKETQFNRRDAQEVFTKLCIREHQYLISLVGRLDKSIKTFMLLEFMSSSVEMSLVVYQMLQSNCDIMDRIAILWYLMTLCAQLFLFYWNAHDIIVQSTELAQAIFECNWSTLDPKLQKMLLFVIQRAQKPIGISIGPFYQVSLDSMIAIFKAIYSYVSVIQQ